MEEEPAVTGRNKEESGEAALHSITPLKAGTTISGNSPGMEGRKLIACGDRDVMV